MRVLTAEDADDSYDELKKAFLAWQYEIKSEQKDVGKNLSNRQLENRASKRAEIINKTTQWYIDASKSVNEYVVIPTISIVIENENAQ